MSVNVITRSFILSIYGYVAQKFRPFTTTGQDFPFLTETRAAVPKARRAQRTAHPLAEITTLSMKKCQSKLELINFVS